MKCMKHYIVLKCGIQFNIIQTMFSRSRSSGALLPDEYISAPIKPGIDSAATIKSFAIIYDTSALSHSTPKPDFCITEMREGIFYVIIMHIEENEAFRQLNMNQHKRKFIRTSKFLKLKFKNWYKKYSRKGTSIIVT